MNREIDERIVAMHFNNEDFERNAKQSIKTLEELKKGLDLEGAAEGFSNISKIASNKMGLQPATKQVGLFSKSLSAMGKVAKSAFGMVTSPIQSVANGFGTLNKYVRAVAGFDIAGKLVSTLENTFREFTIAPLETGFNEYELKMDSIKTIMTGTANEFRKAMGEAYTEEGHLEKVKNALEELNVYADKTIYSFKDMTSNIGKFTNNGVALDAAVKSMQGIANAAALAGQGTQQASMAMYNLSQAIGVGKLTTIDWKSIENANMATLEFKQAFIDVAAAAGNLTKVSETYFTKENQNTLNTLKKKKELTDAEKKELSALEERKKVNDDYNNLKKQKKLTDEQKQELALLEKKVNENGKYYTKEEAAELKALKAKKKRTKAEDERLKKLEKEGEITAENFRNTLSKGWADADIITHVLEIFGGELDEDILRAWGITDPEQIKYFIELGEKAKQAATEVRTFSKMMDALKEAAQSGWAISFEYIFGDMKEATEFWTELNDRLSDILNKSAETRNNLLLGWRGKTRDSEGKIVDLKGATDGREVLIQALRNILDFAQAIADTFNKAKEAIFGKMTSEHLVELTERFEGLTRGFLEWTQAEDGSETNLSKLQKAFRGILSVINMFWKSFKRGISFVKELAGPLIDFFVNVAAKAGEFVENLTKDGLLSAVGKLYDKFKSLTKEKVSAWFQKVGNSVKELWGKLREKGSNWLRENGLSKVADWLTTTGDKIKAAWDKVRGWGFWSEAAQFINGIWTWLVQQFSPVYDDEKGYNVEESPVSNLIRRIGGGLKSAWTWIENNIFPIAADIGGFISDTWNWLLNFISGSDDASTEKEIRKRNKDIKAVAYDFGETAEILDEVAAGNRPKLLLTNEVGRVAGPAYGNLPKPEDTPVVKFLNGIASAIKTAWKAMESEIKALDGTLHISDFFTKAFNWFKGLFVAKENEDGTVGNPPIVDFFYEVANKISVGWKAMESEIKALDGTLHISDFFTKAFNWFKGLFVAKENEDGTVGDAPIVKFIKEDIVGNIKAAWNTMVSGVQALDGTLHISDFFTKAFNWFKGLFVAKENEDGTVGNPPIVDFFYEVANKISVGWKAMESEIKALDGTLHISDFFTKAFNWFKGLFVAKENEDGTVGDAPIVKFIKEDIVGNIKAAWNTMVSGVQALDGTLHISDFFKAGFKWLQDIFAPEQKEDGTVGDSPVVKTIKEIGTTISDAWTNTLYPKLQELAPTLGKFLTDALGFIAGLFKGSDNADDSAQKAEDVAAVANSTAGFFERISSVLGSLASTVSSWDGWKYVSEFFTQFFTGLGDMLKEGTEQKLTTRILNLVVKVLDLLFKIADKIVEIGNKMIDGDFTGATGDIISSGGGIYLLFTFLSDLGSAFKKGDSLGKELLNISKAILFLGIAVAVLGSLDIGTLAKGISAVALLGVLVMGIEYLMASINAAKALKGSSNDPGALERLGKEIIKFAGLALILSELPAIIDALGNAKLESGKLLELFAGLTSMILIVSAIMMIGSKIDMDPLASLKVVGIVLLGIAIFLNGLLLIITELGGIIGARQDQVLGNLDNVKTFMGKVGEILGSFFGGIRGGYEGQKMTALAEASKEAAEIAKNVDLEAFKKLVDVMDMFNQITTGALPYDSQWYYEIFGAMPGAFQHLGEAVQNLLAISGQITPEQFENGERLYSFLSKVAGIFKMVELLDTSNGVGGSFKMLRFFDDLNNLQEFGWDGEKIGEGTAGFISSIIGSFPELFNNAIIEAAPQISVTPLISAITSGILEGQPLVASAFTTLAKQLESSGAIKTGSDGGFDFLGMLSGNLQGLNGLDISKLINFNKDSDDPFGINTLMSDFVSKIDITKFQEKGGSSMEAFINGMQGKVDEYVNGIEMKITPVIDSSSMPDWVTSSGAMAITGKVSIEPSSLDTMRSTIVNQTTRTVNAIQVMTNRISYLEGAISRMSIILDTGVIAGAVNARLGSDIPKTTRRVTSGFSTAAHP